MSKKKINENEYAKIVEKYNSGMTQEEIANIYECSKTTICGVMKKINVPVRRTKFTKSDAESMFEMYKNGSSLEYIASVYNSERHTISRTLKGNGYNIDRIRHHCDDNYFDIIDTQEKAYILGLLWSDGHNCVDLGKVNIQLQEQDVDILKEINKEIKNERSLYFTPLNEKNENWQNTYTLTLKSYHMSKTLESYGMLNNKSLVLEFPKCVDESLYSHFIRGYLDGDGCISFNKINKTLSVEMIGTLNFLTSIQSLCKKQGMKTFITSKNSSDIVSRLGFTNIKDRISFLNWIYKDAHLKIDRKYQKYLQLTNYYNINNSLTINDC